MSTEPTPREIDAALAALAPVFGRAEARATAPTEREVAGALALGPRRPSRRIAPLAGALLLTGAAFAAASLGSAPWRPEEPAPAEHRPSPPALEPDPPGILAPTPVAAPAPPPSTPLAAPRPAPAPIPAASTPAAAVFAGLIGRVEAGERTPELVAALEAFAELAPGPLGAEARDQALRIRVSDGDPDLALVAVDAALDAAPAREDLAELRADLLRARFGDCARAEPAYRALRSAADPRRAARAAAFAGLCGLSLGRPDAEDLLRAALAGGLEPGLAQRVELALSSRR